METFYLSDTGKVRTHNEDNVIILNNDKDEYLLAGANNPIDIDIFDVDIKNDGVLLCSDGLTNMITEEQIERVLNEEKTAEDVVLKLIRKANARGGNDNISIAYLKKESGDV